MTIQEHLQNLSHQASLPQAHINYLYHLKKIGFEPKVIYDIGSCVLHWTHVAEVVWPEAQIILFDAFSPAEFLYGDHDYFMGVLSDEDGKDVRFYQNDELPGGNSYYREIGCKAGDFFPEDKYIEWKTRSLDSVVAERGFPLPDLLKCDTQGSEKDIIAGGLNAVKHAQHLIIEMQHTEYNLGAPKVDETLPYIESLGFKCKNRKFSNNGVDADYGFIRII